MCLLSQKTTHFPVIVSFLQGLGGKVKVYLNLLRSGEPLVSKIVVILSSYVLLRGVEIRCQDPDDG